MNNSLHTRCPEVCPRSLVAMPGCLSVKDVCVGGVWRVVGGGGGNEGGGGTGQTPVTDNEFVMRGHTVLRSKTLPPDNPQTHWPVCLLVMVTPLSETPPVLKPSLQHFQKYHLSCYHGDPSFRNITCLEAMVTPLSKNHHLS